MYSWGFDNVQSIIIRFIFPLYSKSVIDHFISGLNYPYQLTGDGASHRVQHTIITGILYFLWRTTKTFAQVNCLTSISLTKLKQDLSTVFLKLTRLKARILGKGMHYFQKMFVVINVQLPTKSISQYFYGFFEMKSVWKIDCEGSENF